MKYNTTKKAILAIALTMLCFSTWAQMNHNTWFLGFSPMGSMSFQMDAYRLKDTIILNQQQVDTIHYNKTVKYTVVDGFSFSRYIDFNGNGKKEQFTFLDLRLNYLHGRNEQVESVLSNLSEDGYTTPKIGKDFRQVYLQTNYGYIINNKHRVQFPLYIGMALGYAWTEGYGNILFGMGMGAKMHIYITDQLGVYAGGHLMGAFGMYTITTNAYIDFGVSYSFVK